MLCLASTEASDLDGISFAGATPALRRLTPALDAEALVLGKTLSMSSLPVSPAGIISPVVLTRACLQLIDCAIFIVDAGSFRSPQCQHEKVGTQIARLATITSALEPALVFDLFERGRKKGTELAVQFPLLLLAECVPGGTTTAMGLLSVLGYDCQHSLSSSLPVNDHNLRWQIVAKALENNMGLVSKCHRQPLLAVAAVGDPMQAYLAGVAFGAAGSIPVVLSGGSQMLAVFALLARLTALQGQQKILENLAVVTTKYVAFDKGAKVAALAYNVNAPLAASCPDLSASCHSGLRAYEQGNVKEGVGAGAALAASIWSGFADNEIIAAIDHCYEELAMTKLIDSASV